MILQEPAHACRDLAGRADTLRSKSEKSVPRHACGQHSARIYCLLLNSVGARPHVRRNLAGRTRTLRPKSEKSVPGYARGQTLGYYSMIISTLLGSVYVSLNVAAHCALRKGILLRVFLLC